MLGSKLIDPVARMLQITPNMQRQITTLNGQMALDPKNKPFRLQCLKIIRGIYRDTEDWEKAIITAEQMLDLGKELKNKSAQVK